MRFESVLGESGAGNAKHLEGKTAGCLLEVWFDEGGLVGIAADEGVGCAGLGKEAVLEVGGEVRFDRKSPFDKSEGFDLKSAWTAR